MKAVTFQGAKDIQVKEVDDPSLKKRDDILTFFRKKSPILKECEGANRTNE